MLAHRPYLLPVVKHLELRDGHVEGVLSADDLSVPWLRAAREDLVKLYVASNQMEKAKKFEVERSR